MVLLPKKLFSWEIFKYGNISVALTLSLAAVKGTYS
jgi:hypothetical protein